LEKNLQSQKSRQKDISRHINTLMVQVQALDEDIDKLENGCGEIRVTDHAILRYLERIKGVDVGKIRKVLLPSKVEKSVKDGGSGVYVVDTSHKLRVKDRTVVTVLTMEMS